MAIRHRTVEANGISMHVAESGAEGDPAPAVVFLHGFPELWYSWRHQMAHLAARGYRCVAPDLRGYGGTAAPPDVASYSAFHVVGDVVALLDALAIQKVFVVGHDWGAIIAWYLCLFRPDRVTALVNTSVAFMRHVFIRAGAAAVKPTDFFHGNYGPTYYICRFQEPGVAEKEFSPANSRYLMKQILCNRFTSSAAGGEKPADEEPLPPWLTEEDVGHFASEFERTGFTGPINYYRNMDRNWELAAPWADAKVQVEKVKWKSPPNEQYKLNVDTAFSALTMKGGWGSVVRNNTGEVLDIGAGNIQRASSALHAETLAAHHGLKRAEQLEQQG